MQFSSNNIFNCNNGRKNWMQFICKLNFVSNGTVKVSCLKLDIIEDVICFGQKNLETTLKQDHCIMIEVVSIDIHITYFLGNAGDFKQNKCLMKVSFHSLK